MGKMVSTAGEMEVNIDEINCKKDHLIMTGKLRAWDANGPESMAVWTGLSHVDMDFMMDFSPKDLRDIIRRILARPSILLIAFKISRNRANR